jgi:hypothetical protein
MGLITNPATSPLDLETPPSIEERLALVERIAASEHFKRSNRLRDFLLYVGRQSLKEGCGEIHEQEIGSHVFGRSATYDRSQDNIVRVNATELRKRIESYFVTEGAQETLLLEIPRGGYKPVYHWRHSERADLMPAAEPVEPSVVVVQEKTAADVEKVTPAKRFHLMWAAACLVLLAACGFLLQQVLTMRKAIDPWEGKPAIKTFWTDFLHSHKRTDLVLPDDTVSLIEDITHQPISLEDYLNHNYVRQLEASNFSADRKADLHEITNHSLVTFGGVRSAQQMLALIPSSTVTELSLSQHYEADAIKQDNVILIGGRKANPWVHLFDNELNFITDYDYDQQRSHSFVGNRNPKPGELAAYVPSYDPNLQTGYSVVAYLPNPTHTGNAIILAGTDSDATDSAAEFLTSEVQLENFEKMLHVQKFPYFEVLLKTSRLNGTSLSAVMVAYRTYPSSQ